MRKELLWSQVPAGRGRATAVELGAGCHVIINFNSNDRRPLSPGRVQAAGVPGLISKFDVADAQQVKEALGAILEELKRIDVLVVMPVLRRTVFS